MSTSRRGFTPYRFRCESGKGFTLIELVVAVGVFSIIMTLSSGAYLMMINVNRQAQALATGINNLSFALEAMTRDIRTGYQYDCGGLGDCSAGASSFSFVDNTGVPVSYSLSGGTLYRTRGGVATALTDPSVAITTLAFYAYGTAPLSGGNTEQSRVTIVVAGTVPAGPGKTQAFNVETGATMRGSDL